MGLFDDLMRAFMERHRGKPAGPERQEPAYPIDPINTSGRYNTAIGIVACFVHTTSDGDVRVRIVTRHPRWPDACVCAPNNQRASRLLAKGARGVVWTCPQHGEVAVTGPGAEAGDERR